MADTAVPQFSLDDLKSSVGEIHSALSQGGNERELLHSALQLLDKCTAALSALHDGQRDVAKGQRAIKKSQDWLEAQVLELGDKQDASLLAIKALLQHALGQIDGAPGRSGTVAAKSRLRAVAAPDPAPVVDTPAEMVKRGTLLQAVQRVFGPRGGREVPYDPTVASRMLLAGTLTKSEHRHWKTLGRLPDHVTLAS